MSQASRLIPCVKQLCIMVSERFAENSARLVMDHVGEHTCRCDRGARVTAAGLPGTLLLGKAEGPSSTAAVLSFNMPPARNLAAPAARAGDGLQSVLTRRDAYPNSATQPAALEVSKCCTICGACLEDCASRGVTLITHNAYATS